MSEQRFSDREVPIPHSSFERRAFLRGIARLLEFGRVFGPRPQVLETPADLFPIESDWERIGGDLRAATRRAADQTGIPETDAARLVKA